jgi:hypothetical protein
LPSTSTKKKPIVIKAKAQKEASTKEFLEKAAEME